MKAFWRSRRLSLLGLTILIGGLIGGWMTVATKHPPASQQAAIRTGLTPSSPEPSAPDVVESLVDQGQSRTYYLHTPTTPTPTRPQPLIVALHGSGMQGKQMADQTALNQLADREGVVVVYPDALKKKWNVSGKAPEDNVAFVHALIRQVEKTRSIDPTRIYVVGLSNGEILAQKLACENPHRIAAIATVAASLPTQFSTHCQTQKPIPILMVNGTSDPVVPWEGGASPSIHIGRDLTIPSIPTVVDFWQQHNGCPSPPQVEAISDRVEVTYYANCQAQSEVKLVALQGATHIWSGGGYGQSVFGDTTTRVWQFFQRHSLQP